MDRSEITRCSPQFSQGADSHGNESLPEFMGSSRSTVTRMTIAKKSVPGKPRRADDLVRCRWCGDDPLYVAYHDREWGVPVHDDRLHFEFLVLVGAQAGLSWITLLRKRDAHRKAR